MGNLSGAMVGADISGDDDDDGEHKKLTRDLDDDIAMSLYSPLTRYGL